MIYLREGLNFFGTYFHYTVGTEEEKIKNMDYFKISTQNVDRYLLGAVKLTLAFAFKSDY